MMILSRSSYFVFMLKRLCMRRNHHYNMAGSSTDVVPFAKRPKTQHGPQELRDLISLKNKTKTSIVDTLDALKKAGVLEHGITRKDLQHASEHHATQQTPYGSVVQRLALGAPGLPYLDVCNPFAFLYYLCTISVSFANLMAECCDQAGAHGLRLVIYMDEMVPGNPYRPEKSRTLQCVYYAFVDWPSHVLSRTFAWPCLCLIRASVIHKIPGGMTYIARMLLRLFYPLGDGHSMERGILLPLGERSCLLKAVFAGFLCDLKGHKENTEWKGYNGNVCCLNCKNVDKRIRGKHGRAIGIDHYDPKDFEERTSAETFAIVDELEQLAPVAPNFEKLETEKGFNHTPNGLLLDATLRRIYGPSEHTLRDWMHTMCSDGVANSCLGSILQFLKANGVPFETVRRFMTQCTLPSKYGKTHADWLKDSRIKTRTLTSFSGIVLTIVPILYLFFCEFLADDAVYHEVMELSKILHFICGILSSGAEEPMKHIDALRTLMINLHKLYVHLNFYLKPKMHHMHHVIDHMRWLGKLLSCFVTERKHRVVKDAALHVFRHIEHTVLFDVVNKQCEQLAGGSDIFAPTVLDRPSSFKNYPQLHRSTAAIFVCGRAARNDILFVDDLSCGRVLAFYKFGNEFHVEVALLEVVDNEPSLRFYESTRASFVECSKIVDSCIWHFTSRCGVIRVCVPPILLLSSMNL